jgi:hypothetical protein
MDSITKAEKAAKLKFLKAQKKQRTIESKGKFYIVKNISPTTAVFVPDGQNIDKYLQNWKIKHNKI